MLDFINLLHKLKHPEKLGLYGLKFHKEEGHAFYVSAPSDHAYKVKELLAHYQVQEVTSPNLKVLKFEIGKNGILDQQ